VHEAEVPRPSDTGNVGIDVLRLLRIGWTMGLTLPWLSVSIWWLFFYTSVVGPFCSALIFHQVQQDL